MKQTRINPAQVAVVYSWEQKFKQEFTWVEQPEKRTLFGLIKTQEAKVGYMTTNDRWNIFGEFWLHSEKDWLEYDLFEIESMQGLYVRANISIGMVDKSNVRKSFNSNEQMYKWIEDNLSEANLIKM